MKRLVLAAALAAATAGSGMANATVLTFDTLAQYAAVGSYGGLTWNAFYALDGKNYFLPRSGYLNGTVSGPMVAFTYDSAGSIASKTGFTLNSLYLTSAWNDGETVDITGSFKNAPLYQKSLVLNTAGPTLFRFDWAGVDLIKFTIHGGVNAGLGGSGNAIALDNVTINEAVAKVPEPASLCLIGAGLFGMGLLRRRRR